MLLFEEDGLVHRPHRRVGNKDEKRRTLQQQNLWRQNRDCRQKKTRQTPQRLAPRSRIDKSSALLPLIRYGAREPGREREGGGGRTCVFGSLERRLARMAMAMYQHSLLMCPARGPRDMSRRPASVAAAASLMAAGKEGGGSEGRRAEERKGSEKRNAQLSPRKSSAEGEWGQRAARLSTAADTAAAWGATRALGSRATTTMKKNQQQGGKKSSAAGAL